MHGRSHDRWEPRIAASSFPRRPTTFLAFVTLLSTRSRFAPSLIYVVAKQTAFHEFYRVLAPGGHLSIFEPINRVSSSRPPNLFSPLGFDATPVMEIAAKVTDVYRRLHRRTLTRC